MYACACVCMHACAAQVLCGLQHLHSRGIVHRDLKPANILFDTAGAVRVADFGIAKQLEPPPGQPPEQPPSDEPGQSAALAMARSFVGTASYMAPERMSGAAYSFGADVWAVGVVAVECAQGSHPSRTPGEGEIDGEIEPPLLGFFQLLALADGEPAARCNALQHPAQPLA